MNTFLTVTDPIAALLGPWSASLTAGAVVLRIALAAVLAAVIGWERSAKRHAAGLRTFLLWAWPPPPPCSSTRPCPRPGARASP